jgi:tripartite-type tricarboxylate transporter receptor subunit TctC
MKMHQKLLALLVCLSCTTLAHAQGTGNYPNKPISVVSAFAAGGTSDYVGRLMMQKIMENTGWNMVFDFRVGASGHIGTEFAAKAAPDGYTLILGPSSTHAINPALFKKLNYDVARDFAPITLIATTPNVLAVNNSVPANNVRELIAYAKANPGKLAFASAGTGTSIHISGEMFKDAAGLDILHVPFKGSAPATLAVVGGQVQILFENLSAAVPHIKGGRLRALGVTAPTRSAVLPDVPTLSEAGLPGFEVQAWFAMFAPAATPKPIIDRLNAEMVKAINSPDVAEKLRERSMDPRPMTPEQFATFWRMEREKFAAVVKKANITLD